MPTTGVPAASASSGGKPETLVERGEAERRGAGDDRPQDVRLLR